jgi:SAM-dependent methyltransferase
MEQIPDQFLARDHCPACASPDRDLVAELPLHLPPLSRHLESFYGSRLVGSLPGLATNRYRLARCRTCGTHYQIDAPSADWLAHFYRGIQEPGDEPVPTYVFEQRARELAMVSRQLDALGRPKKALDFGAGAGGWARLAQSAGYDVTIMDIAPGSFPRLSAAGIRCAAPFSIPDRDFSLVHVEQVLEHLPDPSATFGRLVEHLGPRGIVIVGVPHDPALPKKLLAPDWLAAKHEAASLNAVAPLEHLNAFSPAGFRLLGERHGLERLETQGWELHPAGRAPGHLRARIGRALRRRLRDYYQPAWALTQTLFLQRPAPSR